MASINPHKMVTCPYNMAHQIEHYRLQFHLSKCRKQYTGCKKAQCPFDSKHIVNEAELEYHVMTCPKREMFDREQYIIDDTVEFAPSAAPPPAELAAPGGENWDNDFYSGYQPDPAKQGGSHIIRKIKGATPSERRKARGEGVRNFKPLPSQPGTSGQQ